MRNKWIKCIANIKFALNMDDPQKLKNSIFNNDKNLMLFKDNLGIKEDWKVKTKENWGSYTEKNYAIIDKENVTFDEDGITVMTKKVSQIIGKDWGGNDQIRLFSCGYASFGTMISSGMRLAMEFSSHEPHEDNNYHWPAVWLMREIDDGLYLEIDLLEKFGKKKDSASASIHYKFKTNDERKMLSNSINIGKRKVLILELIWDFNDNIIVKYNGIKVLEFKNAKIIRPFGVLILSNGLTGIPKDPNMIARLNWLKIYACD